MSSVRILAFNVRNVSPIDMQFNQILEMLESVEADVIVLTECGPEAFDRFHALLEANSGVYAPADYWGNGIIARHHDVLQDGVVDLTVFGEHRSAAVAELALSNSATIKLIATHLEIGGEHHRLRQIEILDEEVGISDAVLVGDLNALNRRDYALEQDLHRLETRRKQGGRPPARWDVMERLLDDFACLDAAEGHPFQATTPYHSRVDYILSGPESGMIPLPDSYRVIEGILSGMSDHNAVVCDIQIE